MYYVDDYIRSRRFASRFSFLSAFVRYFRWYLQQPYIFNNFVCHGKRANKAIRVQTKRKESNFNPRRNTDTFIGLYNRRAESVFRRSDSQRLSADNRRIIENGTSQTSVFSFLLPFLFSSVRLCLWNSICLYKCSMYSIAFITMQPALTRFHTQSTIKKANCTSAPAISNSSQSGM